MTPKQKILNCLTIAYLQTVANAHGLEGVARLGKEDLVTALSRKGSVKVEMILNDLSLEDLKTVCQGMEMDDTGRSKAELVDRIMGRDGGESTSTKKERPSETLMFDMENSEKQSKRKAKKPKPSAGKVKEKRTRPNGAKDYCQYRHDDLRVNNPPVGLVTPESDPDGKRREYRYDPHIDPALHSTAAVPRWRRSSTRLWLRTIPGCSARPWKPSSACRRPI